MKARRVAVGFVLLIAFDVFVLLGAGLKGSASGLVYWGAAVVGALLVAGYARKAAGRGEVVVQESDLLVLSRAVRGFRQGLQDRAPHGKAAGHALGSIRHGLVVIAWKLAGEPFPNKRTDWEILEEAFGEDLPGSRLPWPHALDHRFGTVRIHQKPDRDPHGIRPCPRCAGEIAQGSETCEGCGQEVDS